MSDSKKKILVVDDDPVILEALKFILGMAGYSVQYCDKGEAAVELLSAEGFNLVVSDLDMPGIDGRQLLEIVRKEYPETKVIIHTASETNRDEFEILGAYDVLEKPCDGKALVEAVDTALKDRRTVKRRDISHPVHLAGQDGTTVNICSKGFLLASEADFEGLLGLSVACSIPELRPPLISSAKVLRKGPGEGQTAVSFARDMGQALVRCLQN